MENSISSTFTRLHANRDIQNPIAEALNLNSFLLKKIYGYSLFLRQSIFSSVSVADILYRGYTGSVIWTGRDSGEKRKKSSTEDGMMPATCHRDHGALQCQLLSMMANLENLEAR